MNASLLFRILTHWEALTPEERELVKIINEYSDRNLFKLFSKDKTVKDFIEKVTPEKS